MTRPNFFLSALNDSCQYGESGDRCRLVAPCLAVICWLPVKGSKIPFFFGPFYAKTENSPYKAAPSTLIPCNFIEIHKFKTAAKREHSLEPQARYDCSTQAPS